MAHEEYWLPSDLQPAMESREQNSAILPEEQFAIELFKQAYPVALVDPFHKPPLR